DCGRRDDLGPPETISIARAVPIMSNAFCASGCSPVIAWIFTSRRIRSAQYFSEGEAFRLFILELADIIRHCPQNIPIRLCIFERRSQEMHCPIPRFEHERQPQSWVRQRNLVDRLDTTAGIRRRNCQRIAPLPFSRLSNSVASPNFFSLEQTTLCDNSRLLPINRQQRHSLMLRKR